MLVLMVNAKVKPGKRDEFARAVKEDAESSMRDEPGNFGFYVVQHNDDPDRFFLFEVYKDEAALEAHRQSPHFLKYREETVGIYDGEPVRVFGTNVWPPDSGFAK
ncbi:MAG: putative quinol monooxygenase [Dehalococcoidia bacterium]